MLKCLTYNFYFKIFQRYFFNALCSIKNDPDEKVFRL